MTPAEQKARFEDALRGRGIEPTYTCDGEYSGAFLGCLLAMFRLGYACAREPRNTPGRRIIVVDVDDDCLMPLANEAGLRIFTSLEDAENAAIESMLCGAYDYKIINYDEVDHD